MVLEILLGDSASSVVYRQCYATSVEAIAIPWYIFRLKMYVDVAIFRVFKTIASL